MNGCCERTCALFGRGRSEEHTSELQSRSDLVCRLLLEKKKISPAAPCCIGISTGFNERASRSSTLCLVTLDQYSTAQRAILYSSMLAPVTTRDASNTSI